MSAAAQKRTGRLSLWARALRLPFVGASALPYLLGVAAANDAAARALSMPVLLGFVAVVGAHLCANLVNDVVDTDSGADAQDPTPHGFFGGSKVICAGLLTRGDVLRGAWVAGSLAAAAVAGLAWLRRSPLPLAAAGGALALALAYSRAPLRLSYRGLGEAVVGLLFGPVTVLAGHYARSGVAVTPDAFRLGIVAGLLTTAILIANEVPDAEDDARVGKRTLVVRVGGAHGWLLFVAAVAGALGVLAGAARGGRIAWVAAAILVGLVPAAGAAARLRATPRDKVLLRGASARAIVMQAGVLLALTLERWL